MYPRAGVNSQMRTLVPPRFQTASGLHFLKVTPLRLSLGAYSPNLLLRNSRGYTSQTPGSVEPVRSRDIPEYTVWNGRGLRSQGQDSTKSISGNAFEHVTASGPSRGRLTL